MPQPQDILSFWFDRSPTEARESKARKVWFSKDPEFDQAIATRFGSAYEQAAAGMPDS